MRYKPLVVVATSALLIAVVAYSVRHWRQITDPDYRLKKGQEAARDGNYSEAIQYAERLEGDSQNDRALLLRGEILFHQGLFADALQTMNRIADRGAIRLQAAALQGECLINLGEVRGAEQVFLFVVSEDPRHVDAHRFLATIYYDQGDLLAAEAHLYAVAELDRNDARPHRLIGLIYKDFERFDDAVVAYEESLRRNPQVAILPALRTELAECLLKKREYQRALELTEQIESEKALAVRAEALIGLDRRDQALLLLDEALVNHPGNSWLLRLRGEMFLLNDRAEDALKMLERAVAADSSDFRIRHQYALALERLGKSTEASVQHQKVKQIQALLTELTNLSKEAMGRPWDTGVRVRLAEICDQLGKPQMAAMWRNAAAASAREMKR